MWCKKTSSALLHGEQRSARCSAAAGNAKVSTKAERAGDAKAERTGDAKVERTGVDADPIIVLFDFLAPLGSAHKKC